MRDRRDVETWPWLSNECSFRSPGYSIVDL